MSGKNTDIPQIGADGVAGYYGSTVPATNIYVVNSSSHLLIDSIDRIRESCDKQPDVFTFADYGTGNGIVSLSLIYNCIRKIKEVFGNEQEVRIVYEDLPENEFNQIFVKLREPNSYAVDFEGVFVSSVGRGYFEQCLPTNSLDLGFSVMCMHWLSSKPCNISNGVIHCQSTNETELRTFNEHAAKDWEQILMKRAAEMKKGARFLSVQNSIDEGGSYSGNTIHEEGSLYECMQLCLDNMLTGGRITGEEHDSMTCAMYMRTVDEYTAPFKDENSPVRKAGLNLVSIETKYIRCKYNETYSLNPYDPMEYAQNFVTGGIRPWSNYTIFSGLSENRSLEEKRMIVDEFYGNMIKEISKKPLAYALSYVHAHILFEKK